jgi:hypothetical protein
MSTSRRPTPLLAAAATAVASVLLVPAPAQAASWQTVMEGHRALLQVCTRPVDGGLRVHMRLDNRRGSHAHIGAISAPDGRSRTVRPAGGRVSAVKLLVVRPGNRVTYGVGETDGRGAGDSQIARTFRRC